MRTALPARCARCARVGVPYTDAEIAGAAEAVRGKTEMDALIAYLQGLGTGVGELVRTWECYDEHSEHFAASSPRCCSGLFVWLVCWAWSQGAACGFRRRGAAAARR